MSFSSARNQGLLDPAVVLKAAFLEKPGGVKKQSSDVPFIYTNLAISSFCSYPQEVRFGTSLVT